jgi:hypothetical protein
MLVRAAGLGMFMVHTLPHEPQNVYYVGAVL